MHSELQIVRALGFAHPLDSNSQACPLPKFDGHRMDGRRSNAPIYSSARFRKHGGDDANIEEIRILFPEV